MHCDGCASRDAARLALQAHLALMLSPMTLALLTQPPLALWAPAGVRLALYTLLSQLMRLPGAAACRLAVIQGAATYAPLSTPLEVAVQELGPRRHQLLQVRLVSILVGCSVRLQRCFQLMWSCSCTTPSSWRWESLGMGSSRAPRPLLLLTQVNGGLRAERRACPRTRHASGDVDLLAGAVFGRGCCLLGGPHRTRLPRPVPPPRAPPAR